MLPIAIQILLEQWVEIIPIFVDVSKKTCSTEMNYMYILCSK